MKQPEWAPNSIPTRVGWVDKTTGELLLAMKIPEAFISEWFGTDEEIVPDLDQDDSLDDYNKTLEEIYEITDKDSLEEYARDAFGIELDKRKSLMSMKKFLVKELDK